MTLHSPLSGPVNSGFGGGGRKYKSKIIAGVTVVALVPFLLSTFAASVTVGNGALEFGQGSQQAIACERVCGRASRQRVSVWCVAAFFGAPREQQ